MNLKPEKADTYTAGVVLQPRWIPGLAFTADYFNIKVKGLIGTLGFSNILNFCGATGDPSVCGLIHRDAAGSLWLDPSAFVQLDTINIGGLTTKGVDVNGSYSHKFGTVGTLNASLVGTYLKELEVDTGLVSAADGLNGKYRCEGLYGATCGTPAPKWRHKFRVGFTFPNGLGVSTQWRYFSKVTNDITENDPDMPGSPGSVRCREHCHRRSLAGAASPSARLRESWLWPRQPASHGTPLPRSPPPDPSQPSPPPALSPYAARLARAQNAGPD